VSDAETLVAVRTMLALARVTTKPGLRSAAYRDVGIHLERLRRDRSKVEWVDLVRCSCGLSVSRAYELIAVAKGKTSLDDVRAANAARRRKHYSSHSISSAEKQPTGEDDFGLTAAEKTKPDQRAESVTDKIGRAAR
jgi:hypothetical protein